MHRDTERYVVALLLPVLDDRGVEGWLHRPRHQLGDRTPLELLAAGDEDVVIALALDLVHTV
ncbi:MAG: antitoxin Xre/MbcA/ParS toxin-binding domain-containing protein [Candidatus Nanopelagicales bacterium]|jgi:uncharacterized protein (DUF2384 family)